MDIQKQELTRLVGVRIKYYRHIRSFSQEELALQANLNPAYLGQVERGIKCPTIDTLYKISKALYVSLPELLRIDMVHGNDSIDTQTEYIISDDVIKIHELLARVPVEKQGDVVDIIEKIIKLL